VSAVAGVVLVIGPGDDVREALSDLLIAPRAAVHLARTRPGHRPDDVLLAAPELAPLAQRRQGTRSSGWRVHPAAVLTRHAIQGKRGERSQRRSADVRD
jgi:hypothetical protein